MTQKGLSNDKYDELGKDVKPQNIIRKYQLTHMVTYNKNRYDDVMHECVYMCVCVCVWTEII